MHKWIQNRTKSFLSGGVNKNIRKDQNTAPKKNWGEEVRYPFQMVHIDHNGPLNPLGHGKHHCLVAMISFSRSIHVYSVKSIDAKHTFESMNTFISSFGISPNLVYDKRASFMSTGFSTFLPELGISLASRTK